MDKSPNTSQHSSLKNSFKSKIKSSLPSRPNFLQKKKSTTSQRSIPSIFQKLKKKDIKQLQTFYSNYLITQDFEFVFIEKEDYDFTRKIVTLDKNIQQTLQNQKIRFKLQCVFYCLSNNYVNNQYGPSLFILSDSKIFVPIEYKRYQLDKKMCYEFEKKYTQKVLNEIHNPSEQFIKETQNQLQPDTFYHNLEIEEQENKEDSLNSRQLNLDFSKIDFISSNNNSLAQKTFTAPFKKFFHLKATKSQQNIQQSQQSSINSIQQQTQDQQLSQQDQEEWDQILEDMNTLSQQGTLLSQLMDTSEFENSQDVNGNMSQDLEEM